jgi:protein-tyrosine phosphatase
MPQFTEPPIDFIPVRQGHLAIGHRPKRKGLAGWRERQGLTHLWTLLSTHEGYEKIAEATLAAGLIWEWLPLPNGNPPAESELPAIKASFARCRDALDGGGRIYLHCSAGIHRTGMVGYAFLRYCGLNDHAAQEVLRQLRPITAAEVGSERLRWGNHYFAQGGCDSDTFG